MCNRETSWQKQEGTGAPAERSGTSVRPNQGFAFFSLPLDEIIPPQVRLSDEDKAWIRQMIHEEIRAALDDEERVEARIVTRG